MMKEEKFLRYGKQESVAESWEVLTYAKIWKDSWEKEGTDRQTFQVTEGNCPSREHVTKFAVVCWKSLSWL